MTGRYEGRVLERSRGIPSSIEIRDVKNDVAVSTFKILPYANKVTATQPIVTKARRVANDTDRLLKIYQSCSRTIPAFHYMLKNGCPIEVVMSVIEGHLHDYGLLEPFKIVFALDVTKQPRLSLDQNPTGGPPTVKVLDLFKDYRAITVAEVGRSNEFYQLWTDDEKNGLHTDLKWTANILMNNMQLLGLHNTVIQEYHQFPPAQQGGPLFLALILKHKGMMN